MIIVNDKIFKTFTAVIIENKIYAVKNNKARHIGNVSKAKSNSSYLVGGGKNKEVLENA